MSRLIVASNRVAAVEEGKAAVAGGLAVAVQEAMQEHGGIWFGWSGRVKAEGIASVTRLEQGPVTYATVDLNRQDYELYYKGYSNSTLWPLFHYRIDLVRSQASFVEGYRRVNAAMAGKLAQLVEPDDMIWIHDYHLIPLADELRKAGIGNRIGFFLHIPFPPPDLLTACSEHWDLVRRLMACDLIGFQTRNDVLNFAAYIERVAGGRTEGDRVLAFGRRARVRAFPIGIHPASLRQTAAKAVRGRASRRLIDSLHGKKLLLGVDRLDYSKGLGNRFQAFSQLMARYPENRGDVSLVQIAPPSRSDVESYRSIRAELEAFSGQINGQYADIDWVPIRYLNRSFARDTLTGFLRHARVGLVTPLRDGMNLVAKEFVASQDAADPGVLVLSRFAGAAEELQEALIVNPYDIEQMAENIQRALRMPLAERQARWSALYDRLAAHDLSAWQEDFLRALTGS